MTRRQLADAIRDFLVETTDLTGTEDLAYDMVDYLDEEFALIEEDADEFEEEE